MACIQKLHLSAKTLLPSRSLNSEQDCKKVNASLNRTGLRSLLLRTASDHACLHNRVLSMQIKCACAHVSGHVKETLSREYKHAYTHTTRQHTQRASVAALMLSRGRELKCQTASVECMHDCTLCILNTKWCQLVDCSA